MARMRAGSATVLWSSLRIREISCSSPAGRGRTRSSCLALKRKKRDKKDWCEWPSNRQRQLRHKRRRNRPLQPPANRHRPLALVAHIIRKPQAKKRQRHPAALVFLPHKQHHPAATLPVVDVSLPGGGRFPGEALALPVELPRGDGVIVVAGGGGEQALGLLEGDEEDVALGGFIKEAPSRSGVVVPLRSRSRTSGGHVLPAAVRGLGHCEQTVWLQSTRKCL